MRINKNLNLLLIVLLFSKTSLAMDLEQGSKYKVIESIYLHATYNNQAEKTISKKTAGAYLSSEPHAKRRFTAFQSKVPKGTVITVVSKVQKPWHLYFQGDIYLVKLNPDPSQGLDVTIQLDRGMEGSLNGLNPEIFKQIEKDNN